MKHGLFLALMLAVLTGISSSVLAADASTPREILDRFLAIELKGGRLTADGWYGANHFFLRPGSLPERIPVTVVSDGYTLKQISRDNTAATFSVYFVRQYGRIDTALRFVATPEVLPGGALVLAGGSERYDLTLADKYWDLNNPGTLKEVRGPAEWKIKNFQAFLILDPPTAIRYVSEMRKKLSDPSVKRNAEKSIASLKNLGEQR